jgi:Conserved protein/domain typically associated with flavoprotein oxygenases, DIM6/NTAB family
MGMTTLQTTGEVEATAVSSDVFRSVCGNFATGVTVVTVSTSQGPRGGTVNSFTSLSADAGQIIVCLSKSTSTLRHLRAAGRFAVNVLADHQSRVARTFASKNVEKFADVAYTAGTNGSPLLDGAVAWMECDVVGLHDGVSHVIVVGQVTDAGQRADASPLVFFRSSMSAPLTPQASVA